LAARACEQFVRAMIAGDYPRSVSWTDLEAAYEVAKQAVGRERVIQFYAEDRPALLEDLLAAEAAEDCTGPQ
jgi:uncharacterized protein (DUF1778 family)